MRTVHKFELQITDRFTLDIPFQFKPLFVDTQNGQAYLWAEVNGNSPEPANFCITGTGRPVPALAVYIGTFQMVPFVWHLWRLP